MGFTIENTVFGFRRGQGGKRKGSEEDTRFAKNAAGVFRRNTTPFPRVKDVVFESLLDRFTVGFRGFGVGFGSFLRRFTVGFRGFGVVFESFFRRFTV